MKLRLNRSGLRLAFALGMASLSLCRAAQAIAEESPAPAEPRGIPLWPIYVAVIVAVVIACAHLIQLIRTRQHRTKVFPKVEFRRRLFAPYSGGNYAATRFGSRGDDA